VVEQPEQGALNVRREPAVAAERVELDRDAGPAAAPRAPEASRRRGARGRDDVEIEDELPPALAEMIAQRRDDELAARARAAQPRQVVLPDAAFEDLRGRAESLGLHAALLDGGSTVQMTADLAALASLAAPA
jgi:hypothetical protein